MRLEHDRICPTPSKFKKQQNRR